MSLPTPDLDDRRFDDLMAEAIRRMERLSPAWTDRSPSDPGMVLLDAFAHLTEVMLYRLNRVPDKAYVEFLRLIGAKLHPPAAAVARLQFVRTAPGGTGIVIPRGTQVAATAGSPAPVFITMAVAEIPAGANAVEVDAINAEQVDGELAGHGSGRPGQSVQAARPPIIAASGDGLDLVVAVELADGERDAEAGAIRHDGRPFGVWREVDAFADAAGDDRVYVVDRAAGRITFAPALADGVPLAAVPAAGREIRLWYRRGGGAGGNVPAGAITGLRTAIPGVAVANPAPAAGGRAAEDLDQALVRGPTAFQSLHRAVTARDFEALALRASGGVARARAVTQAAMWAHAERGTVEIVLVPSVPPGAAVDAALLAAQQTPAVHAAVLTACDERRPLGTRCTVSWVRTKTVAVHARVAVHREEDPVAVRARVLRRLHACISPLSSPLFPGGWPFGRALRASHVYDIILAEPGVAHIEQVRLAPAEVPGRGVARIAADRFQADTWWAAAADGVFRSTNGTVGWELVDRPEGAPVDVVCSPDRAGLVAVAVRDEQATAIRVSEDCGQSWRLVARIAFPVGGMAWMQRGREPALLLATSGGLLDLALTPGAVPLPIAVDPDAPAAGCHAVAVARDARGSLLVAVALRDQGGIRLSADGGAPGSWTPAGLTGEDVRCLCIQADGPRRFLWAGTAAPGDGDGRGCFHAEWRDRRLEAWRHAALGWTGGSVRVLASDGERIWAGTHRSGVQLYDTASRTGQWQAPNRGESGLPMRTDARDGLQPVDGLAVAPAGGLALAGGPSGLWRSADGRRWAHASPADAVDLVSLPDGWLFTSGDHQLTVVGDDATPRA